MALFQRQPVRNELTVPYTVAFGRQESIVLVGLGNPGKEYVGSRHNIGFAALDTLAQQLQFPDFSKNDKFNTLVSQHVIAGNKIYLLQPQTFMNLSGQAVQGFLQYYRVPLANCVVVHDELALPFGQIRARIGGQAAGHNGVQSVIDHCGAAFGRVRLGIKNQRTPKGDTSTFVLSPFSKAERPHLPALLQETCVMLTEYLYSGQLPHDTRSIVLE